MTVLEATITGISSALHESAKLKTDARVAKKIISSVQSMDNEDVAQAVSDLARKNPDGLRRIFSVWGVAAETTIRFKELILIFGFLGDKVDLVEYELVLGHLRSFHKSPHMSEVIPYENDFSKAPAHIREKLFNVLKLAVRMEKSLDSSGYVLQAMPLGWYTFVYSVGVQASIVESLIMDSIESGEVASEVEAEKTIFPLDLQRLKKRFDSPKIRLQRTKNLAQHLRGAAESVEYKSGLGFKGYAKKVQEKAHQSATT